jgi:ABC-2 type transport system ATP-binding protein
MEPAISIRGLTKEFALNLRGMRLRAVDNLTLTIPAGQVFGLLGANGSGKSTTIKILLGLQRATAGHCEVGGIPCDRVEARQPVGYLPEAPDFYRHLSGRELLRFYGRLAGLNEPRLRARVEAVLEEVGLGAAADRRVGTYSKGMLQRIGLAQALVHEPRLLILDEPTAGVDPVGTAEIIALIKRFRAGGRTVLLTSHLLGQIEDICDRVAILDRGRLVAEGAVAELVGQPDRQTLLVDQLTATDLDELRTWLAARGSQLRAVETPRTSLDRLYRERVSGRDES